MHPDLPVGRCLACGRPLADSSGWVTDHPDGFHSACRDWSAAPFPFAADLGELRKLARMTLVLYRQIVDLGVWLREVERRWPAGAKRAVAQYSARKTDLRERMERAKKLIRF